MGYIPLMTSQDDIENENPTDHEDLPLKSHDYVRVSLIRAVLCGLMSGIFAAMVLILFWQYTQERTNQQLKSPVPHMSTKINVFEKNTTFASKPSPEINKAWDTLLPPGRGFVYVNASKSYDLEPGQTTPWGEIYSVSLFHQLHCLGQIRKLYWTLFDIVEADDVQKAAHFATTKQAIAVEHVNHCFDYLRQSIMCAGDMALEWPRIEPNGQRVAVDGWGIPHQCKDWERITEYMQENHFDHSTESRIAPGE